MKNSKTVKFNLLLAALIISWGAGLLFHVPAFAQQGSGWINLFQVDVDAFPSVSFYMEARQANGETLANLKEADVQVIEDEQSSGAAQLLERVEPGLQVILAYNLGPALANTIPSGEVRYDVINQYLIDWVQSRPAQGADDFSLATNTGLQVIRSQDAQTFAAQVAAFSPELMQNQPNLTSLLQSLDLATDPNQNPLMKRAILYVTPQPNPNNLSAFPGLIERAIQENVRVFVWLVAPASAPTNNAAVVEPLVELAEKSGGAFFLYSGEEGLPDPETYFAPLRTLYRVTYRSAVKQAGAHQMAVQIEQGQTSIRSQPIDLPVTISPPNLILLNPPSAIERTWQADDNNAGEPALTPEQITIRFISEFPDGHPRALTQARLLVNGTAADQVNNAPFDQLVWDLSSVESAQQAELVVEVQDELGLTARTLPVLVALTVADPPLTFWQSLVRMQLTPERWIILASVLTTGSVLVVAVVLAGRRRNFWRERSAARERRSDPLTQPVPICQEISRKSSAPSASYPKVNGDEVSAWLVPLNERFEVLRQKAIPLTRPELVIGSDSRLAGLVIPSGAMQPLHARLTRDAQGNFWLADNNSAAGTWVNYAPLSMQGIRLQHGDLVHFAKNAYRFELTHPPANREPQLITYNGEYDT